MEQNSINPIESAIIDTVCTKLKPRLTRTVSVIPDFNHRRIAYFLIEAIRAECKKVGRKITLDEILAKFDIDKTTYYDWHAKWHRFLPEKITIVIK